MLQNTSCAVASRRSCNHGLRMPGSADVAVPRGGFPQLGAWQAELRPWQCPKLAGPPELPSPELAISRSLLATGSEVGRKRRGACLNRERHRIHYRVHPFGVYCLPGRQGNWKLHKRLVTICQVHEGFFGCGPFHGGIWVTLAPGGVRS